MQRSLLRCMPYVMMFVLVAISTARAQQPSVGEPITVGILLLNKPYITGSRAHSMSTTTCPKLQVFIISDTERSWSRMRHAVSRQLYY
jgi:hypothetical protein